MTSTVRRIRAARGCYGAAACVVLALATGTPARASSQTWCTDALNGTWNQAVCTATVLSERRAVMSVSVGVPPDLQDHPTAGPIIANYLQGIADRWRTEAEKMARDSTRTIDHQVYKYNSVTTVVFHIFQQTVGSPPNNAYRTFSFDLHRGAQLGLADLFDPGVDPLAALPPLIEPYLIPLLDAAPPPHEPGTYPFTPQEWAPRPDGSGYSGDYRAFAITTEDLILYLPDVPMSHENPFPRDRLVWSMDGGTVTVRVPLPALAPILRPL